jgi:polysaccharide export outer membrane protein
MQPAKLGAAYWCFLAWGCFFLSAVTVLQTPCTYAQLPVAQPQPAIEGQPQTAPVETQQQTNDRIRALSAKSATNSIGSREYVIGKGDLVGVEVYDVPELTRDLRVSQTGTVGLPLVPVRLSLVGLTEIQAQQKIAEVLAANGLVTNPQVMVTIKERRSKPITIVGAVAHPMVYQADRPLTLVQILAEAGGIAPDAGDVVLITRPEAQSADSSEPPEIGNEDATPVASPAAQPTVAPPGVQDSTSPTNSNEAIKSAGNDQDKTGTRAVFPGPEIATQSPTQQTGNPAPPAITSKDLAPPIANTITVNLSELLERGDIQNNIALQAGDLVTVPHAGIVYALGAVQRPGGFVGNNDRAQLSTLKLLALAGGMTRVAKKGHAVIIRKDSTGKQQEIPVDLGKIVDRKSEDVRLMPSDILYVPDNATKAVLIRASEIGVAMATTLAIYRIGAR